MKAQLPLTVEHSWTERQILLRYMNEQKHMRHENVLLSESPNSKKPTKT